MSAHSRTRRLISNFHSDYQQNTDIVLRIMTAVRPVRGISSTVRQRCLCAIRSDLGCKASSCGSLRRISEEQLRRIGFSLTTQEIHQMAEGNCRTSITRVSAPVTTTNVRVGHTLLTWCTGSKKKQEVRYDSISMLGK